MKRHSADANHLLVQALAAAEGNKRQAASCPVCTLPHHGACAFACSKCGRDITPAAAGARAQARAGRASRSAPTASADARSATTSTCGRANPRAAARRKASAVVSHTRGRAHAATATRAGLPTRDRAATRLSPPQRIGGGQATGACRLFASRQGCRFGDRCKFAHDAGRAGAYGAAKALEYKAPAQGSQNARGQDSADRAPGATHGVHPDRAAQVTQGIQQDRE